MQRLLFDVNAIGLAAAGLIALLAAWKPTAWWLPLQAPLGIALVGLGLVDGAWMMPELATDVHQNEVLMGVDLTVAIASIVLGGLFGVQLIARIGKRDTIGAIAQMVAPYQLMLGLVAIADWLHA
jgi:hypothetical protein